MKIGACMGMGGAQNIMVLKNIGYEYVETGLWEAYSADDAKKDEYLNALAKAGLKCEASAYAFPGVYNPAGKQTAEDIKIALEKFYDVISKTRYMENEILVVGAGGVRNYPVDQGYDINNVYDQLAQICAEVISPVCAEFGLTAALEGLQKRESPTFNLTEQAVMTAKKSGKDNIKVMTDYFHIFIENEDMTKFSTFGDYIVHAHIANPVGRVMPCENDGADYTAFFGELKKAGYNARCSVEAGIQGEYEPTMAAAFKEMKKYKEMFE
ncbi:MAG: sugar phosphate isomerase/epimerase [Oscillospiraceae bacterium]|nr:sugar phosphate isomerase/epimerase [Oscillospiraceae bacterium]